VFDVVQSFEEQHPNLKNVKGSVIIPALSDYPADALAAAHELGVEVLHDTGRGFESADQPVTGDAAGKPRS